MKMKMKSCLARTGNRYERGNRRRQKKNFCILIGEKMIKTRVDIIILKIYALLIQAIKADKKLVYVC